MPALLCRWLHDAALMQVFGLSLFLAGLVPGGLRPAIGARLRPLALGAAILLVLSALVWPLLAVVAGDVSGNGEGTWSDLAPYLFDTTAGRRWSAQVVGALLLLALLARPSRRWEIRAATAGALLAGLALIGHGGAGTGRAGELIGVNAILHLLAAGAWLGSLLPLVALLPCLAQADERAFAVEALRRFSTAGHAAVALVLATGLFATIGLRGASPVDATRPYDLILCGKLALVLAMIALALVNRYVVLLRIARAPAAALQIIRRNTLAGAVLGAAILAASTWLGSLDPQGPEPPTGAAAAASGPFAT